METIQNFLSQFHIEGLQPFVAGHIVMIGVCVFTLFMVYTGYHCGFIDRALSLGALVITLMAEIRLFPYISAYIQNTPAIREFFLGIAKSLMKAAPGTAPSPLYEILGLNLLADNAARMIEDLAAKIVCFVVIFIIVRLALMVVSFLAGGLKKITIVDQTDKLLGSLFGLAESLIFIWLFMLVVSGLPDVGFCRTILDQIEASPFLSFIYQQNLLLQFVRDLFR